MEDRGRVYRFSTETTDFVFFKLPRPTLGPNKPCVMCPLGPFSTRRVVHRMAPAQFLPISSQRLHVDGRLLASGVIAED